MIKPLLKTLSLALATFVVAASASAADEKSGPRLAVASVEGMRHTSSSQAQIDKGWENQQALIEARIAARASGLLRIPGAIITPPLSMFAPFRTEGPALGTRNGAGHASSTGRPATARSNSNRT